MRPKPIVSFVTVTQVQRLKDFSHPPLFSQEHSQRAGFKVGQLGPELMPTWVDSAAISSFTHYATFLGPRFLSSVYLNVTLLSRNYITQAYIYTHFHIYFKNLEIDLKPNMLPGIQGTNMVLTKSKLLFNILY